MSDQQEQLQQEQNQPLIQNEAIDQNLEKVKKLVGNQNLRTLNFTFSLIMLFAVFSFAYNTGGAIFSMAGSFLFLLFMIFSIIGMYGEEKKAQWATTVYKNAAAVYCLGFVAMFIVSIVALASHDAQHPGYGSFTKGTVIIFAVVSLPYAVWMAISFYVANKE